jgi:hypothetical protein
MGSSFGRQVLETVGESVQVSCDGRPRAKAGGVTIDWSTVAAAGADVNLEDGFFCPSGEKYLRYGQILARITQTEVQQVAITGSPTGGTFTLTGTNPLTGVTTTSAAIAYNANAAAVQTQTDAIFGAGNTLAAGGPLPGTPVTITFQGDLADQTTATLTHADSLTGGTSPAVAVTTPTAADTGSGAWGPYDPAATDGRQTLARGSAFILNVSVREADLHSNHPPVIDGGRVWKDRVLMTTGTHSLAAGPTVAEFEAVFPSILYAIN